MPTKQRRNHASSANAVKQKQALENLQDSSPAASVKLRRSSRHGTRDQDETDERVSIAMTLAGLADHMPDTCIAANKDVDMSNGCKKTITGSHQAADAVQQDATDLVRVLPAILRRKSDDNPKSPTVTSSSIDSRHNVKEKLIKKLSKDKETLNRQHVPTGSEPTTDEVPAESADKPENSKVTWEKKGGAAKLARRNPKKKSLSTTAVSSTAASVASNKNMDSVAPNGDLPDRTEVPVSVASSAASPLDLPSSAHVDVGLMSVPVVLVPVLMPGSQSIQFVATNTNLMSNVFSNQTFNDGTAGFTAVRPAQLIGNSTFTVSGVSSSAVQSAGATFVASSLMHSQQRIIRPPISVSNIGITPGVAKFIRTSSSLVSVPAVTPTTPISVTLPGSLNSIQQSYRNSLPTTNKSPLIKLETAPNDCKDQTNEEDTRPNSQLPATVCNENSSSVQSAAAVAENKPAVDTTAGSHQEQGSVQKNLGSLQSLREYYSSIQRKDQSSNTNVILVASHQNNSVVSVTGAQGSQPLITNNITSALDHCVINTGFAGNVLVSANNASVGSIRVLPQLKTQSVNSSTVPQLSTVISSLPSASSDATNCLLVAAAAGDEAKQNHKRTAADDSASVLKKRPRRSAKEKRIKNKNTGNESGGMCGSVDSASNVSTEPTGLAADAMCLPLVTTTGMNCVGGKNVVNCSQSSLPQDVTSSSSNLVASHPVLQPDEDGDYPLHIAVVQCNLPLVQHILSLMKEITHTVDFYNDLRQTPLHLASYMSDARIVRTLLDAGASPNCPDRRGLNCLHTAVERNNVECLRELLTHDHSSVCIDAMNYEGLTPLHIAVQHNSVEIVELLLSAGANVDVVDGKSGHSPLYLAAQHNSIDIARLLLQNGANVQLGSYYGCTPVQAASARANHGMVKLLQQNGAIDTSTSDKVKVDANESSGQKVRQKGSRQSTSVPAASASHSRASSPDDETAAFESRTHV